MLPTDDPEKAAVIAGWKEYWRVYEKYAADPTLTDLTETQYVTTGEEGTGILESLDEFRHFGLRSEGGMVFRDIRLRLESGAELAHLEYCLDLSGMRVYRIDTGERYPRSGVLFEVADMEKGADGKWRVSRIVNKESTC